MDDHDDGPTSEALRRIEQLEEHNRLLAEETRRLHLAQEAERREREAEHEHRDAAELQRRKKEKRRLERHEAEAARRNAEEARLRRAEREEREMLQELLRQEADKREENVRRIGTWIVACAAILIVIFVVYANGGFTENVLFDCPPIGDGGYISDDRGSSHPDCEYFGPPRKQ